MTNRTNLVELVLFLVAPHTWRIPLFGMLLLIFSKDHLHIRGEYYEATQKRLKYIGSPPHTWRIPIQPKITLFADRITSTYVENTLMDNYLFINYEDHLHIRGEYPARVARLILALGSPPHTWRIRKLSRLNCLPTGITSTYVENTDV